MTLPRWSLEEVLHQAMMVEAMDRFVKYINPVSYTIFFYRFGRIELMFYPFYG